MRLVDIEPILELVKGEHEKVQNRFSEANVFKEPNDVALWGAVLQEVGAFIGLMINAPTVDAVPVIRCKDCALWEDADSEHLVGYCTEGDGRLPSNGEDITFRNEWCCWAERTEE